MVEIPWFYRGGRARCVSASRSECECASRRESGDANCAAMTSIEAQLQDLLKEAMRNKDARTADCVRMIKTKHMERRTAAGFKGPLDDNLWLDVIGAYQK